MSRDRVSDFASAARRRPVRNSWRSGLALAAGIVLGVALGPVLLNLARERAHIVSSGADVAAAGAPGMASRHGVEWRIPALQAVTVAAADTESYRQAATSLPPLVPQAAEATLADDPLDVPPEAQARDHHWRSPAVPR